MSMAPRGYEAFSTLSPEQSQLFQQLLPALLGQFQGQGNQALENKAKKQFFEETVPGLADRFSNLGLGSSSSFNQALTKAGTGLSEELAGIGQQNQMAAIAPLMQLLGMNTQGLIPEKKPWWQDLLSSAGGGFASALGGAAGGALTGGLPGAGLGALQGILGKLFSRQDSSIINPQGQITGQVY